MVLKFGADLRRRKSTEVEHRTYLSAVGERAGRIDCHLEADLAVQMGNRIGFHPVVRKCWLEAAVVQRVNLPFVQKHLGFVFAEEVLRRDYYPADLPAC